MDNEKNDVELDGAEIFSDWETLVGAADGPKKNDIDALNLDNLMMGGDETHWLQLFQKTNLLGMDLIALKAVPNYVHDFKAEQTQLKAQSYLFLVGLVQTHANELRVAGLSEDQIDNLNKGILPINWTVHLKYPVSYGGVISANNLVLMPHQPFHEELHHFLNRQLVTDAGVITPPVLYVPVPKSAVYVPFNSSEMPSSVIHFEPAGGSK